jgi:hypothetical protein
VTLRDFGPRLSAFNSMFSPRHRQVSGGEALTVPAISLDEFCNRNDLRPDVVKIDAESAESHILAGMRRLLTEHRVALTLEAGDAGVKGAPASTKLLSSVLDHGYVPDRVSRWRPASTPTPRAIRLREYPAYSARASALFWASANHAADR